jgi:hypothetical protein
VCETQSVVLDFDDPVLLGIGKSLDDVPRVGVRGARHKLHGGRCEARSRQ